MWFQSSEMTNVDGYLTGRLYYLNEIKVTCSDTSAIVNNVQVNVTSIEEDCPAIGIHKTYNNATGQYTRNIDTRITYNNKYSSTRTYNTCHLQIVVSWESANNNTYIQIEVTPKVNADNQSVLTRPVNPIADAIAMQTIIDALAESEDIQGIIDYLETLDTNVQSALNYITTYYPTIAQRLSDLCSLQVVANEKLQYIYNSLMTWYTAWLNEKQRESEIASQAQSEVDEQQNEVSSIESDMTYETVNVDDVGDNANDIITGQVVNQRFIHGLWDWLQHPLVLPFLVTSVTFAVVGFILYGKKS